MTAINATVTHRVKGKDAITRSLRALLIRTHRYARCRVISQSDRQWAARMLDQLQVALDVADHTRDRG